MIRCHVMVVMMCLAFFLVGCNTAETIVEPTQYKSAQAKFPAGQICVDSNVGGAPFVLRDRDQIIEVTAVTYACFVLQVGEYEVAFREVKTYSKTPPKAALLQLKDGLRFDVMGLYAQ